MKLSDLRKLAVKQQTRVQFRLSNGMICTVDEHGIARVAELNAPPQFNLEEELAGAQEFTMEALTKQAVRNLARQEVENLVASATSSTASHVEED